MIYPWQQIQWQKLWQAHQAGRLPHALMLSGMVGIGKYHFAQSFAQRLLCQTHHNETCSCHSCHLIEGRAHPDVLWIEPEKPGGAIKVDQVRALADFAYQTALQGRQRVVIIHPAEDMNTNSANALLKTLEEPPAGSFIILVTNQPSRLPATIRSRCQQISFQRPSTHEAMNWLATQKNQGDWSLLLRLAHGAPLRAAQLNNDAVIEARQSLYQAFYALSQRQADPLKVAASLDEIEPLPLLDFSLTWVMDLLRLLIGNDEVVNSDYCSQLSELSKRVSSSRMLGFLTYLQKLRAQLCHDIHLNKQLMVETLFIRWMETVS